MASLHPLKEQSLHESRGASVNNFNLYGGQLSRIETLCWACPEVTLVNDGWTKRIPEPFTGLVVNAFTRNPGVIVYDLEGLNRRRTRDVVDDSGLFGEVFKLLKETNKEMKELHPVRIPQIQDSLGYSGAEQELPWGAIIDIGGAIVVTGISCLGGANPFNPASHVKQSQFACAA